MATSSIFANVKISTPEQINMFVKAMDASLNDPAPKHDGSRHKILDDPDAIRTLLAKEKHIK